jgi:hypothetical protein
LQRGAISPTQQVAGGQTVQLGIGGHEPQLCLGGIAVERLGNERTGCGQFHHSLAQNPRRLVIESDRSRCDPGQPRQLDLAQSEESGHPLRLEKTGLPELQMIPLRNGGEQGDIGCHDPLSPKINPTSSLILTTNQPCFFFGGR